MAFFSAFDDIAEFIKGFGAAKGFEPKKTQKLPFSGLEPTSSQFTATQMFGGPPTVPPKAPPLKSQPQPKSADLGAPMAPFKPVFAPPPKPPKALKSITELESTLFDPNKQSWTGKTVGEINQGFKDFPKQPKAATGVPPDWQQVGPQLGSNKGGQYADPAGQRWYVKDLKTESHARNETMANALYRLAGADVPEMAMAGKQVRSKMVEGTPLGGGVSTAARMAARRDFAADAWLANWDVAGTGGDNIVFNSQTGKAYRIDTGGALDYRAKGEEKTSRGLRFSSDAEEVDSLRGVGASGNKNPDAKKLFGDMSPGEQQASARKLMAVTPEKVAAIVAQYGPKDPIAQRNLVKMLMRRRDNVVTRITQPPTTKIDPTVTPAEKLKRINAQMGVPMRSYHGVGYGSNIHGHAIKPTEEGGFWSTPSKKLASMYSGGEETPWDFNTKQGKVAEFINDVKDYLVYDAKGKTFGEVNSPIIKQAREGYYPGVIVKNVWDEPSPGSKKLGKPQDVLITMDLTTQRLAQANFDPKKASLNNMIASGAAVALPPAIAAMVPGEAKAGALQDKVPGSADPSVPDSVSGDRRSTNQEPQTINVKGLGAFQFPAGMSDQAISQAIEAELAKTKLAVGSDQRNRVTPGPEQAAETLLGAERGQPGAPGADKLAPLPGPYEGIIRHGRQAGIQLAPRGRPFDIAKSGIGEIEEGLKNLAEGKTGTPGRRPGTIPPGQEAAYARRAGKGEALEKVFSGAGDVANVPLGVVSPAIEKTTGIKKETSEALMALGLPFASGALAKTIGATKTFLPSAESELARALLRQGGGWAARETAKTKTMLEPFYQTVSKMDHTQRLDLYQYIEGASKGANPLTDPKAAGLADQIRTEMQKRRTTLENMETTQDAHFVEDYFPHMWEDPNAAQKFANGFGAKQGSGGNLKKRSIPTIADGLAAGLKLKTTDPIEATVAYAANMDRYIASNAVMEVARDAGTVRYIAPGSKFVPPDWRPLDGRHAQKITPAGPLRAYAPKEFAGVYNAFVSKGVHANETAGKVYDMARKTSNAVTALELGLSGYHGVVMANEAGVSSLARGIRNITGGASNLDPRKMLAGVGHMAESPVKPITSAMRGQAMSKVYLGLTPGTAKMNKIVDLLEKAGGRAVGFQHAPDYEFSAANNYWTAWKRGTLQAELMADKAKIAGSPLSAPGILFKHIGRSLQTVAKPLFEHYVPHLKSGAFHDAMSDWLELNPLADEGMQIAEARKIWDSIDNRFGEMVQDNIFWSKAIKQTLQLAMRSYSWNMGTVREIGGGAADIATGKGITARASYAIALPIWTALMNASYQYIKTGKSPESVDDLMAGRTGGTAKGASVPSLRPFGRSTARTVPERAMVPGYQKDVFGWYEDAVQEAKNKVATAPRMIGELATNKDWKGDLIRDTNAPFMKQMAELFNLTDGYFSKNLGPISVRQLIQGEQKGSMLNKIEQAAGIRPAPAYLQDPKGYAEANKRRASAAWKRKTAIEAKQKRRYGGPNE